MGRLTSAIRLLRGRPRSDVTPSEATPSVRGNEEPRNTSIPFMTSVGGAQRYGAILRRIPKSRNTTHTKRSVKKPANAVEAIDLTTQQARDGTALLSQSAKTHGNEVSRSISDLNVLLGRLLQKRDDQARKKKTDGLTATGGEESDASSGPFRRFRLGRGRPARPRAKPRPKGRTRPKPNRSTKSNRTKTPSTKPRKPKPSKPLGPRLDKPAPKGFWDKLKSGWEKVGKLGSSSVLGKALGFAGGALAGVNEFEETGDVGQSASVAGGTMAGMLGGAIAGGLVGGPIGGLIGSVIGGIGGEKAARSLYKKLVGDATRVNIEALVDFREITFRGRIIEFKYNSITGLDDLVGAVGRGGGGGYRSGGGADATWDAPPTPKGPAPHTPAGGARAASEIQPLNYPSGGYSTSYEGLRIKGGANGQAVAGGNAHPGVIAAAHAFQNDGVNRFTSFNDQYHAGTRSKHAKGLALDYTLNDPSTAPAEAQRITKMLEDAGLKAGVDFDVIDEYNNPSSRATGGHMHVEFNTPEAAERFRAAREQQASRLAVAPTDPNVGEDLLAKHGIHRGAANLFSNGRRQENPLATDIVEITTPGGQSWEVRRDAAPAFLGFLTELEASGYPLSSSGGHVDRLKRGGSTWSEHAFGNSVDVNAATNPFQHGLQTDLPPDISDRAARWGLSWGGDWRGKKDPMHFEWTGIPTEEILANKIPQPKPVPQDPVTTPPPLEAHAEPAPATRVDTPIEEKPVEALAPPEEDDHAHSHEHEEPPQSVVSSPSKKKKDGKQGQKDGKSVSESAGTNNKEPESDADSVGRVSFSQYMGTDNEEWT